MSDKIQQLSIFLSGTDIRNITGLSVLSIPDGLQDDSQKAILATYAKDITEEQAGRFPSTFWDQWGEVFADSDSDPFVDDKLDMTQFAQVSQKQEQTDDGGPPDTEEGENEQQSPDAEKTKTDTKEPEPDKTEKKSETKTEKTESEPDKTKPASKKKKNVNDPADALFRLIPAEDRLDIMLQHVNPDDFGSLTKDQLTEITRHLMSKSSE